MLASALRPPGRFSRQCERLGNSILTEWQRTEFDTHSFTQIAKTALGATSIADDFRLHDIVRWLMSARTIAHQVDLSASFGEPPITMYYHPAFRIEVLCWNTATTGIHHHAFAGAFTIISGASLQASYTFTTSDRASDSVHCGQLTLTELRHLPHGTSESIEPGDTFIHAVYHLEAPTLTLVARTHEASMPTPQFQYDMPGLAVDPFYKNPVDVRRLQMLRLLGQSETDAHWTTWAIEALQHATLHGAYQILICGRAHLRRSPDCYAKLSAQVLEKHGSRGELLLAAAGERARLEAIQKLRARVRDPIQRLLLGACLYSSDIGAVTELLTQAVPDEDTASLIARHLGALAGQDALSLSREADDVVVYVGHRPEAVILVRLNSDEPLAKLLAA
jgi:hypothetical protein